MAGSRDVDPPFLKRWSQRKLAAARDAAKASSPPAAAEGPPTTVAPPAAATTAAAPSVGVAKAELPAVESLTFESDFTAFLKPDIAQSLRRDALRKLFADPRFNVMDGLDVYIDDYGKSEPIPAALVGQLNQAKYLFDPPKTRVNARGYVEDVPEEEAAHDERQATEAAHPTELPHAPDDTQATDAQATDDVQAGDDGHAHEATDAAAGETHALVDEAGTLPPATPPRTMSKTR